MPPGSPIRIAPVAIARHGHAWRVRWRLENVGPAALTVTEAWHPHARFQSSRLRRSLRVPAAGAAELVTTAHTDVRRGERAENCFLILRASSGRLRWLILARCTVVGGDPPALRVESIDVHPAE